MARVAAPAIPLARLDCLARGKGSDRKNIGTAVLGAGPAGLTSAWVLARRGRPGHVFEADGSSAGSQDGRVRRVPLRPRRPSVLHQAGAVRRLWETTLGEDFLGPRLSRIYYEGRYLAYPLQATDVFRGLGISSPRCAPPRTCESRRGSRDPKTFEDGSRPFRQAPVRHVLQVVHREGVGHPGLRDRGRVGRAADQGLLAREGDPRDDGLPPREGRP